MREIGKPVINVSFADATPEDIVHNRKNVERAFQSAMSRGDGEVKLRFLWNQKPADRNPEG